MKDRGIEVRRRGIGEKMREMAVRRKENVKIGLRKGGKDVRDGGKQDEGRLISRFVSHH